MKKIILLLSLFLSCFKLFAQLVVTSTVPPATPATAIQNFFGGNGITIANVTYSGATNAAGAYQSNGSNIGTNFGVLLSTGIAADAGGANTSTSVSTDLGLPGDADLDNYLFNNQNSTFDAATIEFDFISSTDSVFMKFVYASEEYPELVGSAVGDPIGIFLSGPGILGLENIAVIPGTSTPIGINTVNSVTHSASFIDNTSGTTVQFDGFTRRYKINAVINSCQVYHMKIVIADGGDGNNDSGLFLESGSFLSGTTGASMCMIGASYTTTNPVCDNSTLGTIDSFAVSGGIPPYSFTIDGNATSMPITNLLDGTYEIIVKDASTFADTQQIVIAAPSCSIVANFNSTNGVCFNDCIGTIDLLGLSGGVPPYHIKVNGSEVQFPMLNLCANLYSIEVKDTLGNTFTTDITITTNSEIQISTNPIDERCVNDTFQLDYTIQGGVQPYSLTWGTSPIDSISPLSYKFIANTNGNYLTTVEDAVGCINQFQLPISVQEFGFFEGIVLLNGATSFLNNGDTLEVILLRKSLVTATCWVHRDTMKFTNQNSNYHFEFDSITDGAQYVILAKILNSSFGQEVLPTYSGNKYLWGQAVPTTIIGGVCNLHTDTISMVNTIGQASGSGSVSGVITLVDLVQKTHTNNDPIPLIDVVIEKDSLPKSGILVPENPIGSNLFPYNFLDLPAGNYKVKVQIAGIPMVANYPIFAVVANSITQVDFCADTFGIGLIDTCSNFTTSISTPASNEFKLYPNPSEGSFTIELPSSWSGEAKANIYSLLGERVSTWNVPNGKAQFVAPELSVGLYFVEVEHDGLKMRKPMVVARN